MKKTFFLGTICLMFAAVLFLAEDLLADNIQVGPSGTNQLQVTKSSYTLLELNNSLSDIEFFRVKSNGGYFTRFRISEYGQSTLEGYPSMPVIRKLIEVPLNSTIQVDILSHTTEEIELDEYGISDYVFPTKLSKPVQG